MAKSVQRGIQFVVQEYEYNLVDNNCYLIPNTWDDFSFKTTFEIIYKDAEGKIRNLSGIKVMQRGQERGYTQLPPQFTELDESYCSLGNSQEYYEEMMNLPEDIRLNILRSLRDCIFNPAIFTEFSNERAMRLSLLRDTSDSTIGTLYPSILKGHAILTPFRFRFLLNNNPETSIEVDVTPDSLPPTNIHALIGRNGVGKTRIVSGIMDCITKAVKPSQISMPGTIEFGAIFQDFKIAIGDGERFTNLIVVVWSAFDNFQPNRNLSDKDSVRCDYIGLKQKDNTTFKTTTELAREFVESFKTCINSNRRKRWIEAVTILCSDPIFKEYKLNELDYESIAIEYIESVYNNLSSGHRIILLTITRLVQLMDEKTLVLIDEPENHLHPPLLSSFVKALSVLAIQRNAVVLIATHSPVVLQEVPKICTTKINRVGSTYTLSRPEFETYGENIDILTRDVFRLELEESGFYITINDHLQSHNFDYDSLLQSFSDRIGSEAKAIALAIIASRRTGDA
ncbi:MAG: AAA family ATPase [Chitinophagaceae bacterium]|nr:AAA family ATPase [Chitinophagaceae bacterium]